MPSLFVSRFPVIPERRAEFTQRFVALYRASKPILDVEAMLIFYGWSRTGEFTAVESYRDESRLNAMRATDGFKQGFRGLAECCSGSMTIEIFSGIDLDAPSLTPDKTIFEDLYPAGSSPDHPVVNGLASKIL